MISGGCSNSMHWKFNEKMLLCDSTLHVTEVCPVQHSGDCIMPNPASSGYWTISDPIQWLQYQIPYSGYKGIIPDPCSCSSLMSDPAQWRLHYTKSNSSGYRTMSDHDTVATGAWCQTTTQATAWCQILGNKNITAPDPLSWVRHGAKHIRNTECI